MNTVLIAFRNMSRQKKRSFLLGGAIAFGVLIITMLNSFTAGMVVNVKENFSQILAGHIYISGREETESGKTINLIHNDDLIMKALEDVDVKYITKRSSSFSTLVFGSKELMQSLSGVNWSEESYFKERLILTEGSFDGLEDPTAIIIASSAAKKLGVEVGENIIAKVQTVTGQSNVGEFKVIAFNQDSSIMGSFSAYVHLEYLNSLLNMEAGEFQSFNIFLENMDGMDQTADKILESLSKSAAVEPREKSDDVSNRARGMSMMGMSLGGTEEEPWEGTKYTVSTLNDMMSGVMSIISVLNIIGLVVFLILLLITMVGITNTFRMILVERTREIGTIRAIGMQRNGVLGIFLLEALFIAMMGSASGVLLGVVVMGILRLFNFGTNTPFFIFMNNGHLTFTPMVASVFGNVFIVAVTSLLAALFPASKAARLDPAKALGTHY